MSNITKFYEGVNTHGMRMGEIIISHKLFTQLIIRKRELGIYNNSRRLSNMIIAVHECIGEYAHVDLYKGILINDLILKSKMTGCYETVGNTLLNMVMSLSSLDDMDNVLDEMLKTINVYYYESNH